MTLVILPVQNLRDLHVGFKLKNMRKMIFYSQILVLSFGVIINASAQEIVKEAKFNSGDGHNLYQKMGEYGQTHQTERWQLDSVCRHGFIFVKFKVDEKSMVKDIVVNVGTPPILAQYLKNALKWTNGNWEVKTVNRKPTESQYFLLPVIYLLEADCPHEDHSYNDFWRMIRFDGTEEISDQNFYDRANETLDCIMLHPYMIKSPIH